VIGTPHEIRGEKMIDWTRTRVAVTGGAGFLGAVVCRKLEERGCTQIFVPRRSQYDLTTESGVRSMYEASQPEVVIHLAAEVGGIGANRRRPGRFFFANAAMGLHLIEQARARGLRKFVQVATVCAYPKFAPVPFRESDLWNGYPEETNAPYGIAKKSLLVMLDAYRREYGLSSVALIPVNLYGPRDNFDLETSHVIPALIRKAIDAVDRSAPSITCWGTGSASREFLYVDDAAEAIVIAATVMEEPVPINLGTGNEITIRDLVSLIARICGFNGRIEWDPSQPDGQPRRCLDTTTAERLLGWKATTSFEKGLAQTVEWFKATQAGRRP
jgi:GDP-L-fucose synthase